MRLRLVTMNTAKEDRPYVRRLELLAAGLADLRPDLVLLQETFSTPDGRFDTTRDLAAALGMPGVSTTSRLKPRRVEGDIIEGSSGLGLLSRLPIIDHERLVLPTDPRDGERIALLAGVESPAGDLLILNVHLTYLQDAGNLRRRQVEAVFAHPWLARRWRAIILGGDFNTYPAELPALLSGVGECWSWLDTYPAGDGVEPRLTKGPYREGGIDRCVDYLVAIERAGEPFDDFSDSAVVLTRPDDAGIYPSDHRGIMTDLHLDVTA